VVLARRHAAAHGDAGFVHGVARARDQVVPPAEVLAPPHEALGAGGGYPRNFAHALGGALHAAGHLGLAAGVVGAAAGVRLQQATGDVGEVDAAVVLVFELYEAAAAAAVTQRLPLDAGEVLQRLLPVGRRPV